MPRSDSTRSRWQCPCGARLESEEALLDHQEWCLGDGQANARLIQRVVRADGAITHEALVAAVRQQRLVAEVARLDD